MKQKIENIVDLLTWHQQQYPLMQVQDVYKLLFQAAMGAEHLIENWEYAKQRFFNECYDVRLDNDAAQFIDPVSLDGNIVRLNFRQALKNNSPEVLWEVFSESVQSFNPDVEKCRDYWQDFVRLTKQDTLHFDKSMVEKLHQKIIADEFPVMHHSQIYRKHYKPSYRIVKNDLLTNLNGVLDE